MKTVDKKDIVLANKIIEEMGGVTALARWAERAPASVHRWRTAGIPSAFYRLLKKEHPELKAWSNQ